MVINKTIVMAISLSNRSCPYEFNASIDCWLKTTSHYDVSIWWRHHGSMVIASSMRRKDSSYGLTFYTYRKGYWGRLMLLKMNRWVFPRNSQLSWITYTVETLYSTIYYSKYFIEINFDKSTQYVALWTHKRHPIPRPFGRAMECLLWVLQQKLTVL